jgi:hypothetical protein
MNSTTYAPQLARMPFMSETVETVVPAATIATALTEDAEASLALYRRTERFWRYHEAAIFSAMLIVVVFTCAVPWMH